MIDDTCSICERPLATDDDLERFKGRAGDHLCFREYGGDCDPIDWASRFDNLRAASRALAGIDAATLDAVTPAAMRAVMERRGWRFDCALPWFADQTQTAYESWEHATAQGAGSRGGSARMVPDVLVPVLPGADAAEIRRYVAEWAWALATRHGDVSPAEVLAEAIAAGVAK